MKKSAGVGRCCPKHFNHCFVKDTTLDAGTDPDARNENGYSPLHNAVHVARLSVITALLHRGADPNAQDHNGWTPLSNAVSFGGSASPDVIAALLNAGADPTVPDMRGRTPLHSAVSHKHPNHAEIAALLHGGADPNVRDGKGKTPWDVARENDALTGTDILWMINDARFR